jgi:hypothetical protein
MLATVGLTAMAQVFSYRAIHAAAVAMKPISVAMSASPLMVSMKPVSTPPHRTETKKAEADHVTRLTQAFRLSRKIGALARLDLLGGEAPTQGKSRGFSLLTKTVRMRKRGDDDPNH